MGRWAAPGYGREPKNIEFSVVSIDYRTVAGGGIAYSSLIMTLPRLGSRVRIPSPAPKSLRDFNRLRAALRGRFCFPALGTKAGEAGGKQQKAQSSAVWVTFGMDCAHKPPFSAGATGRDGSRCAPP